SCQERGLVFRKAQNSVWCCVVGSERDLVVRRKATQKGVGSRDVFVSDQVHGWTRLEHHENLRWTLDWREKGDRLLAAVVQDAEIVRRKPRCELSTLIEDADIQLYEFSCGSQLRRLR